MRSRLEHHKEAPHAAALAPRTGLGDSCETTPPDRQERSFYLGLDVLADRLHFGGVAGAGLLGRCKTGTADRLGRYLGRSLDVGHLPSRLKRREPRTAF